MVYIAVLCELGWCEMEKTEHGWDIVQKYIKHECDKETKMM